MQDIQESPWRGLISKAIERAADGTTEPVKGAKLRPILAQLAMADGLDLAEHLRANNLSFSAFLEAVGDVALLRRPGTDMLVARTTSQIADAVAREETHVTGFINSELFSALTVFAPGTRWYYDRAEARAVKAGSGFTPPLTYIPLPAASLESEIETRRQFAANNGSQELADSLDTARPLTDFRTVIDRLELQQEWHRFRYRLVRQRLIDWAAENHVEVQDDWFRPSVEARTPNSLANTLRQLAGYMSDDDLKELRVPLSAVQALLSHRDRRS